MAFLVVRFRQFSLLTLTALLVVLIPQTIWANGIAIQDIQIYGIPDHIKHQYYPCIFSGNDGCHDPSTWPPPSQTTTNDWNGAPTLFRDYVGADFTAWSTAAGSSFVLGLDFNTNSTHATLQTLTVAFYDGGANLLAAWAFPQPFQTPDIHNGDGFADYVFAAGCAVTPVALPGFPGVTSCAQYLPFVAPAGAAEVRFAFGYSQPDDGDEDLYVIRGAEQPLPEVPEPATLLLLSTGLLVTAWRLRRRA